MVDLLERQAEVAALDALIAASTSGGALALIRGPAGIGKTRLLGEARTRAHAAGMEVLAARGSELEREFAFGVARQLFEPLLSSLPEPERAEALEGAASLAAPLFDPAHLDADRGETPLAMLHGLYWLTVNLAARRPVLLAIDDLHWADAASLRWLAYLLPRIEGVPVLLVTALRPREPHADLALLGQISSDPLATTLRPAPLSEQATGNIVGDLLAAEPAAAFRAACHRESGGNPLLLHALANALAGAGIEPTEANAPRVRALGAGAVGETVSLRLARVSPEARRLARAVAILGDDTPRRHAAAIAEIKEEALDEAALALSALDVLESESLGFVHPVVRAAVYAQIPPAERDAAHRRAARVLSEAGAEAERVAAQLLHAPPGGEPWVVAMLRAAAREATARGAVDSAVAYLRRALEEPPDDGDRASLLVELGSAERLVSGPDAAGHLEEALELAGEPATRARIAIMLARALGETGRGRDAIETRARAVAELAGSHPDLGRQLEAGQLGQAVMDPSLYPWVIAHRSRLEGAASADDLGGRMLLATLAYDDARRLGSLSETTAQARQALAGGVLLGDESAIPPSLMAGLVLAFADSEDAGAIGDAALAHAHRRGSAFAFAVAKLLDGKISILRGAVVDGRDGLRAARLALESWGIGRALRAWVAAYLADALIELGDLREAEEALSGAGLAEDVPDHAHTHWYLESRGRLRVLGSDVTRGLDDLLECGRRFEGVGGRNPAFIAWRSEAALAYLRLDEGEKAARLAAEEVELARGWGAPRALGRALRVAGLVAGGDEALLREAVETLEGSPARLEHAKALVELGAALRRANRRAAAREPLRRGLELATICDARPLAEHAQAELVATGARPRRIALTGVDSLTPSERRVADLASEGRTNREIAQALYVTPRTVEVHLTSAYRKLEIGSRSQLASVLTKH